MKLATLGMYSRQMPCSITDVLLTTRQMDDGHFWNVHFQFRQCVSRSAQPFEGPQC